MCYKSVVNSAGLDVVREAAHRSLLFRMCPAQAGVEVNSNGGMELCRVHAHSVQQLLCSCGIPGQWSRALLTSLLARLASWVC